MVFDHNAKKALVDMNTPPAIEHCITAHHKNNIDQRMIEAGSLGLPTRWEYTLIEDAQPCIVHQDKTSLPSQCMDNDFFSPFNFRKIIFSYLFF